MAGKTPQPGTWWFNESRSQRVCVLRPTHTGRTCIESEDGWIHHDFNFDGWHHEMLCTGWEWEPSPHTGHYKSIDDDMGGTYHVAPDYTVTLTYPCGRVTVLDKSSLQSLLNASRFVRISDEEAAERMKQPQQYVDLTSMDGHVLRSNVDEGNEGSQLGWVSGIKWPEGTTVAVAKTWGWKEFRCRIEDAPTPSPPVESPDDWVTQDRVPARPGIDQRAYLYDYDPSSVSWDDASVIHWNDKPMHGDRGSAFTVQLRCRRRDLPPLPEPQCTCPTLDGIKVTGSACKEHGLKTAPLDDITTQDPGEGWRLAKHDEKPHPKAQYWSDNLKEWTSSACHETNEAYSTRLTYRVPVESPKPATRTIVFHEVVIRDAYQDHLCFVSEVNTDCHIPTGRTETREVPR
jgi:hypothetical protein